MEFFLGKFNYWVYIVMMMIGFYAMIAKHNLVKKVIGMNIFQTAIILFYISIGTKKGGTIPILEEVGHHAVSPESISVVHYINPLPHVLMLTAIVVGVSVTGVALALIVLIYRRYHTVEEDEILRQLS
jgi:multicomponent Na+:H+ antiporter subunit C